MEEIKAHHRKIACEICKNRLMSVYIRGKSFRSLEDFYYCEICKKIYKIGEKDERE